MNVYKNILKMTVVASMFYITSASAKSLIIGDSHVGGIKMAVPRAFAFAKHKNGSTIDYWLKVKPIKNLENLYVMTGTNDYRKNVPAKEWYEKTMRLCRKWKPDNCYVIAPPVNSDYRYLKYRRFLRDKPNVIYVITDERPKDGVHFSKRTYRWFYQQIKFAD